MKNIAIILLFIFLFVFLSGCEDTHKSEVMTDYNKYNNTFNKDLEILSSLENEWNSTVKVMPAGNFYTDKDINNLSELARNYSNECSFVAEHNSNFKRFIAGNESILRNLNIDTYTLNKTIIDFEIQMSENSKLMNETVKLATLAEYNRYNDTLNNDLNTLSSIVDEWNSAVGFMPAGNFYTDKEVNKLSGLARDYSNECRFAIAHNSNFKIFIASNENILRNSDVDVYTLNKTIIDSEIQMSGNSKLMDEKIKYAEGHTMKEEIISGINGLVETVSKLGPIVSRR